MYATVLCCTTNVNVKCGAQHLKTERFTKQSCLDRSLGDCLLSHVEHHLLPLDCKELSRIADQPSIEAEH